MSAAKHDSELRSLLAAKEVPQATLTREDIALWRAAEVNLPIEQIIRDRPLRVRNVVVRSFDGHELDVTILSRTDSSGLRPGIVHPHSGGMVIGTRFTGAVYVADWVERLDVVAVLPEYRLAPEFRYPAQIDDTYSTLLFSAARALDLGIDADQLILAGMSAGGGIAAGTALRSRDTDGPSLAGLLLMCPMLDYRNSTPSSRQFAGSGLWDQQSNEVGWSALLGDRRSLGDVSIYASPAIAEDLSGLPPTFVDVGSMDTFRDEDIAFASRLLEQGQDAELHVWRGGYHGSDQEFPAARLSRRAADARADWLSRLIEDGPAAGV